MYHEEQNEILSILTEVLKDELAFAMYFGSFGTKRFIAKDSPERSDIDLALFVGRSSDFKEQMEIRSKIYLCEKIPYEFDIVFLDDADPIIKKQILDHGTPFLINDRKAYLEFRMRAISEYIDFKMDRKIIEDRMIQRYAS